MIPGAGAAGPKAAVGAGIAGRVGGGLAKLFRAAASIPSAVLTVFAGSVYGVLTWGSPAHIAACRDEWTKAITGCENDCASAVARAGEEIKIVQYTAKEEGGFDQKFIPCPCPFVCQIPPALRTPAVLVPSDNAKPGRPPLGIGKGTTIDAKMKY